MEIFNIVVYLNYVVSLLTFLLAINCPTEIYQSHSLDSHR